MTIEMPVPPAAPQQQIETPAVQSVDGVQQRIAELTAERAANAALMQEQYKTIAQQAAEIAASRLQPQMYQQPQAAAPVDPLAKYKETVDPHVLEALQSYTQNAIAGVKAQAEQQLRDLKVQFGVQQIATVAQAASGLPPEVIKRAQFLYQQAQASGANPSHDEAINFAIGEWYRGGGKPVVQAAQPSYAPQSTILPMGAPAAQRAISLPQNFNQLSRSDQMRAAEAAGIGDMPI